MGASGGLKSKWKSKTSNKANLGSLWVIVVWSFLPAWGVGRDMSFNVASYPASPGPAAV